MAPWRAAFPPVEGPCLADEPADRDDGVGKVGERVDDVLVALLAALQVGRFPRCQAATRTPGGQNASTTGSASAEVDSAQLSWEASRAISSVWSTSPP